MANENEASGAGLVDSLQRFDALINTYERLHTDPNPPQTAQEMADYLGISFDKYEVVMTFLNTCDRSPSKSGFLMGISDAASLLAMNVARGPEGRTLESAIAAMNTGINEIVEPEVEVDRFSVRNLHTVFNKQGHSMQLQGKSGPQSLADVMKVCAEAMLKKHFDRDPGSARRDFGTDYGAAVALAVNNMGPYKPAP